jgi:hypothetical protein
MISSAASEVVGCMQVKQGSEGRFETLCAVPVCTNERHLQGYWVAWRRREMTGGEEGCL